MALMFVFLFDVLLFIAIPLLVWRLFAKTIPLTVLSIIVGLVLAAIGWGSEHRADPPLISTTVGFIGVLLLAFTAGLETRHSPELADQQIAAGASLLRVVVSALNALIWPFAIGALCAYFYFNQLPGWSLSGHSSFHAAIAIGLCLAVSALPVLIGIVRELKPVHRRLGQLAVKLAVIDDVVLWSGLALLLIVASGKAVAAWGIAEVCALLLLASLVAISRLIKSALLELPVILIIVLAALFLTAGAWSTSVLGLHALLGAYFAGVIFPVALIKRLPVERAGMLALFILAPLFFGYSGLRINPEAFNMTSLGAAAGFLLLSVTTKIFAVFLYPPSSRLSRRETLGTGALLQCKGLMEIVAATILHDQGLLSQYAYAALVMLAVMSTLLTGPLFRLFMARENNPKPV